MTNSFPPLIEPNGRISHIRLSERIHRAAFQAAVPIERDLKLPNFVWGCYPGCPGHPRVLRFASSHCVSVPPWLLAPFEIMQINATMRDSDFSGDALRLTGAASLCALLGLPIPRVLPVYPDWTSRRAVHADPAGALSRLRLLGRLRSFRACLGRQRSSPSAFRRPVTCGMAQTAQTHRAWHRRPLVLPGRPARL